MVPIYRLRERSCEQRHEIVNAFHQYRLRSSLQRAMQTLDAITILCLAFVLQRNMPLNAIAQKMTTGRKFDIYRLLSEFGNLSLDLLHLLLLSQLPAFVLQ